MGPNGVLIGLNASLWIFLWLFASLKILMRLYGSLWVVIGP